MFVPQRSLVLPYTTLFRSHNDYGVNADVKTAVSAVVCVGAGTALSGKYTDHPHHLKTSAASGQYDSPPAHPGASAVRCPRAISERSEEHTSELQSRGHLVCRLLL